MGMFDYLTSEYRGIGRHIEFQTKDLCNQLDRYRISYDGKLFVSKFDDDYKEDLPYNFSGSIKIYGIIPNIGRPVEYIVDFIEGYVTFVEKL